MNNLSNFAFPGTLADYTSLPSLTCTVNAGASHAVKDLPENWAFPSTLVPPSPDDNWVAAVVSPDHVSTCAAPSIPASTVSSVVEHALMLQNSAKLGDYVCIPVSVKEWGVGKSPHLETAEDRDTPTVGRDWPNDGLHDAARRVVGGMKDLAPSARKAVQDAAEKAGAAPTGRAARDGALGRALGARPLAFGLRTGA